MAALESEWRWPWAGLLAAAMVIAIDVLLLGPAGPWDAVELVADARPHSRAVVRDRQLLREAREVPADDALVFVVGSSRADRGVIPDLAPDGFRYVKLTHLLMGPLEIRCAVEDVLQGEPAVVVLPLSEFDTHGPTLFDLLPPEASFRNLACFRGLVAEMGPALAFERRQDLLRNGVASLLHLYHLRPVLRDTGLASLQHFPDENRIKRPAAADENEVQSELSELSEEIRSDEALLEMVRSLNRRFRGRSSVIHRAQFLLVRNISRGEHVRVQQALVERAVSELHSAGVEVLIVETPIFEGSYSLYDSALGDAFRDFARALSDDHPGVEFLPLEDQPAYGPEDFGDMTHLNRKGAAKFSLAIRERLERWRSERDSA